LFLWSALSYKVLLKKPVRTWHIMLAHLAAAGPGRVIPGGAGYLSFGTLFLTKQGLKLPQALAVAVTNNLAGFLVNTVVLSIIFAINPDLLRSLNLSSRTLFVIVLVITAVATAVVLARRSKRLKKGTKGTGKELMLLWRRVRTEPQTAISLVSVMLATIATNGLMLYFAAHAVGLELPFGSAIVTISAGVALGSLLPTPGGVGGVEAGLIACMYALGFDLQLATSAALLFRFASYIEPFLPGVAAYFYLRKKRLF